MVYRNRKELIEENKLLKDNLRSLSMRIAELESIIDKIKDIVNLDNEF